jgi:hypothetical protein
VGATCRQAGWHCLNLSNRVSAIHRHPADAVQAQTQQMYNSFADTACTCVMTDLAYDRALNSGRRNSCKKLSCLGRSTTRDIKGRHGQHHKRSMHRHVADGVGGAAATKTMQRQNKHKVSSKVHVKLPRRDRGFAGAPVPLDRADR